MNKRYAMRSVAMVIISLLTINLCGKEGNLQPDKIKVMTYNVLGRKFAVKKRIPALFEIIEQENPDIIAMQEVTAWFIKLMEKEAWYKNYQNTFITKGKKKYSHYGLGIISKYPISNITLHKLPTKQKRHLLAVTLKIGENTFKVITCHLDSLLFLGEVRKEQLKKIWEISEKDQNVLVLGDFNFGDNELPETLFLSPDFTDLWTVLNPDKPGFTWNMEKSKLAINNSFHDEKSRRLDRILLKSPNYKPFAIKIIGNKLLNKKSPLLSPSREFPPQAAGARERS